MKREDDAPVADDAELEPTAGPAELGIDVRDEALDDADEALDDVDEAPDDADEALDDEDEALDDVDEVASGGPLPDEIVVTVEEVDTKAEAALEEAVAALRGSGDLVADLEALLFSTHSPLTPTEIAESFGLTLEEVQRTLIELEQRLAERAGPVALFRRPKHKRGKKLAGPPAMGFILDVKAAFRKNVAPVGRPVLSPALTETLALIALNQPLSQSRLVREKGSTVYEHVKDLVARGWVQKHRSGRSYDLQTTDAFASEFGLENDPTLIKRALARAAGAEGAPEVVGSERVAFATGDVDLAAEAASGAAFASVVPIDMREFVGPPGQDESGGEDEPGAEPTAEEVEAAIEAVHADGTPASESCLVSGGEVPTAPRPQVRAAFAAAPEPEDDVPASVAQRMTSPAPARDDGLVSGGRPKSAKLARAFLEEETMATTPTPDHDDRNDAPEESAVANRLSNLLELIDDDATTDDW